MVKTPRPTFRFRGPYRKVLFDWWMVGNRPRPRVPLGSPAFFSGRDPVVQVAGSGAVSGTPVASLKLWTRCVPALFLHVKRASGTGLVPPPKG